MAKSPAGGCRFNRLTAGLLWTVIGLGCGGTLSGFLGQLWWRFELLSHFRVQYMWLLVVCGLSLLLGRRFKAALIPLTMAVLNAGLVFPLFMDRSSSPDGFSTVRTVLINVHAANSQHSKVIELLHRTDVDIAVLLEVTPAWADALQALNARYEFSYVEPRPGAFGVVLYSRINWKNVRTELLGPAQNPAIVARFEVADRLLTLMGTQPPASRKSAKYRNRHFSELARFVRLQKGPMLLLGDLNCTSWSPYFQTLLKESELRDSRQGFGVQASWPAWMPPLRIPIDHCLVSSDIEVYDRRIGPDVGSDHLPLIVDIAVRR